MKEFFNIKLVIPILHMSQLRDLISYTKLVAGPGLELPRLISRLLSIPLFCLAVPNERGTDENLP